MFNEKGSLKETSIIKLLLTIFEEGLTGVLNLQNEGITKSLYFNRGKLIWASSSVPGDKLENILISLNMVAPKNIERVRKGLDNAELLGKTLVEKGLLTLEDLIDSSKVQVKGIVLGTLRWKEGIFQFTKGTQPEGLLNLDLNVTDFVTDFILKELHIGFIEDEIRAFQVYFERNPDNRKIEKYNLTEKQSELLNSFDGKASLADVLSRYAGANRESLLKIIYFFLVSEILVEKMELAVPPGLEDDIGTDIDNLDIRVGEEGYEPEKEEPGSYFVPAEDQEEPDEEEAVDKIVVDHEEESAEQDMSVSPEEPVKEIISVPDEEIAVKFTPIREEDRLEEEVAVLDEVPADTAGSILDEGLDEKMILTPDEEISLKIMSPPEEEVTEKPVTIPEEIVEDKKKVKQLYFLLIFVALILIISGVIFLYLNSAGEGRKDAVGETDTTAVIDVEEKEPKVQGKKGKGEPEESAKKTADEKKSQQAEKVGVQEPLEDFFHRFGIVSPELKDKLKESPTRGHLIVKPGDSEALKHFKQGEFVEAGNLWKKELENLGSQYSVLLEMDCMKQSVINAYLKIEVKENFFILNRGMGSRNCFLVMWGKFTSRQDAAESIRSIPDYFWRQQNPPVVVNLERYMN